ncbi:hypothetical protein LCGC14_0468430 [marine sediment metagenome]|uniref:Uncharacterized protein n=1 Tax=marine sediment metagenome TaxID=412755 RepID=A0A0F9SVS7_9ZZZZ
MIFVPRRNIYTRRPYWQRGSVSVTPFANAAQQGVLSLTPLVTDVEIWHTGGTGQTRVGIIFHDYRAGSGSDDGRILTKKHFAGGVEVITDMGNDDAGPPVDHTGEWTDETVTESEWEVANVSIESGTFSVAHAAVGVYSALDTQDMLWQRIRTGGPGRTPGTTIVESTFRVREVADTANFTEFTVKLTAVQT